MINSSKNLTIFIPYPFSKLINYRMHSNIINIAKKVFEIEAKEIACLSDKLTDAFPKAVNSIAHCKGKIILIGMGKSGIIAKKIASTFASTGVPSFFMHPGEAYHGDLGMIESKDIVILLSNSGETDELLKLIPFVKDNKNIIISMTGNSHSTLAQNSHYHLDVSVKKEACPLQLAPTSSTTAALVMGDALAVALMESQKFQEENFARFHPGGNLGKRLLTTVDMVMKKDNLPVCTNNTDVKEVIQIISKGGLGLVVVFENKIEGIITDGDIRRAMESNEQIFFTLKAKDLMTINPIQILPKAKIIDAEILMTTHKISSLLVSDQYKFVGITQIYDFK